MSKVFGFKIGGIGLEFPSQEDREKALIKFTRSSTVKIYDSGVVYRDDVTPFGTYERDSKEVQTKCYVCDAIFTHDTCHERVYMYKNYSNKWEEIKHHICDGCLAGKTKDYERFKAKELLNENDDD